MEDGTTVEGTRYNSSLWTFIGKAALYNHVYVAASDEFAIYTFQGADNFFEAASFMIENEFPLHMNITEPAEEDIEAYERFVQSYLHDLGDFPPEWRSDAQP